MPTTDRQPWRPLLDARTPYGALDGLADTCTAEAMAVVRRQVNADGRFSVAEQRAMVASARPLIWRETRQNLEAIWVQCRLRAAAPDRH
jgi:hypothetical protein